MEIAYTAHTEACTYLLDAEGICRSVLAASNAPAARGRPVRIPSSAERCIGAQYVASLDLREAGALVAMPRPGAQLLFARTEKNGRITLVRTAPLVRFETVTAKAQDSGVRERACYVDDDDERTIPFASPTVPFRRELLAPILRASMAPPAPAPARGRTSSVPPSAPERPSGIVPAGTAPRATIPPPPPLVRNLSARPPAPPRGPTVVRATEAPSSAPTLPSRRRAAR